MPSNPYENGKPDYLEPNLADMTDEEREAEIGDRQYHSQVDEDCIAFLEEMEEEYID